MTSLTEEGNFLDTSSKRQQYFELFVNFYKKDLGVSENKIKHLKGLSKIRRVEKLKAYGTFFIMHRLVY